MADISYRADGVVKVSTRLNVRKGNGTSTSIIGKLTSGTKVKIVAKTSDKKFKENGRYYGGYKIEYKGSKAYVCTKYIKITKTYKDDKESYDESNDNYILTGTGKVAPNIKLDVRQVINLQGLGKYLSGYYYVEEVNFEYSASGGFSQNITVSKNAFGSSINSKPTNSKTSSSTSNKIKSNSNKRTYTVKKGDTLWGIAKKYYKNGSKWTYIAKANKISTTNQKEIRSLKIGRVLTIPYL